MQKRPLEKENNEEKVVKKNKNQIVKCKSLCKPVLAAFAYFTSKGYFKENSTLETFLNLLFFQIKFLLLVAAVLKFLCTI